MNLYHIVNEIEKMDPEACERLDTRRNSLKAFSGLGKKLALTALPLALGGMFKKAYGQTSGTTTGIIDVLNFALSVEYLESSFFSDGLNTTGLITDTSQRDAISKIALHETQHVAFLTNTITTLGGTPVAKKPSYDYTAGGAFPTALTDINTFLAIGQTFEDTGVRAYKGQAGNVISNNDVLLGALKIHSMEARHASHLRRMRGMMSWITGNTPSVPGKTDASYAGEDLTVQATINIVGINGMAISTNAATEAFDEALTKEQVLAIVAPFGV